MTVSPLVYNKKDYKCSICLDLYKKPIMLKCQHVYCEACIHQWKEPTCPDCRAPLIQLSLARHHNEIVEKIKQVKAAKLAAKAADKIPTPLSAEPLKLPHKEYFNAATRALLLKLQIVSNIRELAAFEDIMRAGSIPAEGAGKLLSQFLSKVAKVTTPLKHEEAESLFAILRDLIEINDQRWNHLAVYALNCFLTSSLIWWGTIGKFEVNHLLGTSTFDAVKAQLFNRPTDPHTNIHCLSHIVAHASLPENYEKELFECILKFSQNNIQKENFLLQFLERERLSSLSTPFLIGVVDALVALHSFNAQSLLPTLNQCTNKQVLNKITSHFLDSLHNPQTDLARLSSDVLLLFDWMCGLDNYTFTDLQRSVLDQLIEMVRSSTHAANDIALCLAKQLQKMHMAHPAFFAIYHAYITLLNDDRLNSACKLHLLNHMPLGENKQSQPLALQLFFFMHEKIGHLHSDQNELRMAFSVKLSSMFKNPVLYPAIMEQWRAAYPDRELIVYEPY